MTASVFDLTRGDGPLVISMPHCGTELSPGLAERLTPEALTLSDTDWHIPRLYDFAGKLGATLLSARFSRYVVDLNRPPDGKSLYPGQATTGLCPDTLFDGRPLYRDGQAPGAAEIADRVETHWRPYHDALEAELARVKARHGFALLYDAHSIRSHMPRLFDGRLPDLNLGTARGTSADPALIARIRSVMETAATAEGLSCVTDGRFVGGHITRHYGRPAEGVHAFQMELAQDRYMDEDGPPFAYRSDRADRLRRVLTPLLESLAGWRP
ncbi:N-formylglutamate deformylase [Azospirillum doebereinerae]|uniref:N-formylglutamate deformylase n=1 Tax=Azospirillum doebereinerae TaxID=92933 RepID=A0A433J3Q8_9PROT|nr:N-formylglutamate deformylase [Azospirillum doebereinerae]MCG5241269.1 N-formylglutamate deformylase [Azospirillum doebereinerae]RUQ66412.1 N-formylglutamate deformylase [Azospirillum doebereinerae]